MARNPLPWTCLNSPIEFWEDFKIPRSLLSANDDDADATTPTPTPGSQCLIKPRLLQRSHLQTQLPTELLLPLFKHEADPLDKLALALTCKRLLQAAALLLNGGHHHHHHRIRVPSICHHAHLEPPCPAMVRLQSILESALGFPLPPERVGNPYGPWAALLPPTPDFEPEFWSNPTTAAPLLLPSPYPDLPSPPSSSPQRYRYYFGYYLPTDLPLRPPTPLTTTTTTTTTTPDPNPDPEPPVITTHYCPGCHHYRPAAAPYWRDGLLRRRDVTYELRAEPYFTHPDDISFHPLLAQELFMWDALVTRAAAFVVDKWAEGLYRICPDCWLRAAQAKPRSAHARPWDVQTLDEE